jgi:RNA polymerase subunit RPABC4/transcription elongation factor Spt4
MGKIIKLREIDGKNTSTKEEKEKTKGTIIILNPEESEVAKSLKIKEKGIYGVSR